MIAVVSTTFREVDVVDLWIRHTLAENVDLILVADKLADDGTRDILDDWHHKDERVEWVDDPEPFHFQAHWTNELARRAHERGADFILPADVDEFVYATNGGTIAEALADCQWMKICMTVWPHKSWDYKFQSAHRLPKVCYRWTPDALVSMGSHDVSISQPGVYGLLDMRELQYRSFEHFCRKAKSRNETLSPDARARNDGSHHLRLEGFSQEQMQQAWDEMQAQSVVFDPIPSHA